jgi:WD40 repeat protein
MLGKKNRAVQELAKQDIRNRQQKSRKRT